MGNRWGFNQSGFNAGDQFDATKTHSPDQPYMLQLRNAAGELLHKIEGFYDGEWKETVNAAGELTFSLPLDSILVQTGDFVYPNRVYILDSTATILSQYVLISTIADANNGEFKVKCAGLLYLLNQEYSPNREETVFSILTIEEIVIKHLAFQNGDNPITLGYIHPSIANIPIVDGLKSDKSVMATLLDFWQRVGGVITVDAYGRLRWDTSDTDGARYVLSLYNDIEQYSYTIDNESVYNRIVAKGKIHFNGIDRSRREVTLNDAPSQAIYGIRTKRVSFGIGSEDEITERAQKMLDYTKAPQGVRDIGVIDLSKIQLDPDNPETPSPSKIHVGAKIKINPPYNIPGDSTFSTMILSVSRKLNDPLAAKITVGEKDPDQSSQTGSNSEFFDYLGSQFDEYQYNNEVSQDQDEDIWSSLESLSSNGEGILPVGEANDDGVSLTKSAAIDHVHFGLILIEYDAAITNPSALNGGVVPLGAAMAHIGSAGVANEGRWYFPPDGTALEDWQPDPAWN
jgi:hypothetical protein